MDVLSDVLRAVRLTGAYFYRVEAGAPWSVATDAARQLVPRVLPETEHLISYHILLSGTCWAGLEPGSRVCMKPGDVIVFPHGDPHVLSSAEAYRPEPRLNEAQRYAERCSSVRRGGARQSFVCGFLGCDADPFNPLLGSLPRCMHLPGMTGGWLAGFPQQAVDGVQTDPGRGARRSSPGWPSSCSSRSFGSTSSACPRSRRLAGGPTRRRGRARRSPGCTSGRHTAGRWRAGPRGGLLAHRAGRAILGSSWACPHPVPDPLAASAGGGAAAGDVGQGRDDRRQGGLRVRGRLQPRLQARDRDVARRLAEAGRRDRRKPRPALRGPAGRRWRRRGHGRTRLAHAPAPPDAGEMMERVTHGVILEHELAGERRVGVQRDARRPVELRVGQAADRRGRRRAVGLEQGERVRGRTASYSLACFALISCTPSQVTPTIGVPSASICASPISSGYIVATWCTTTPTLRPSPGRRAAHCSGVRPPRAPRGRALPAPGERPRAFARTLRAIPFDMMTVPAGPGCCSTGADAICDDMVHLSFLLP